MSFSWTLIIDLGIIAAALLLATLIRARVWFFQKFLIPNSLTAGFLLLPFFNFLAPGLGLGTGGLENLVFHLLNISFISMGLRTSIHKSSGKGVFSTVITILSQYSLQSLVGFGITFLFIATILPQLFPTFGFSITLGFCLGPGQAFAIGSSWENFGFVGGGTVGLTFAAFGFLWGIFGGIYLINLALRRGWIESKEPLLPDYERRGVYGRKDVHPEEMRDTTVSEAIDPLSYNLAVVLGVYILTFLFLKGLTGLLTLAGPMGGDLASSLWGISFVFALIFALLAKKLLQAAGAAHTMDNGSLSRIAGTSVDIMVAASVGAISLVVVAQYWLPILTMGLAGGLVTTLTLLWLSSRIFSDFNFHRLILIFGCLTGTLPTGLALLRVIDREFKTPASFDYMYAAGITFLFAIPFILSMNFPAYGYTLGKTWYYWVTVAIYAAYLVFVLISFRVLRGRGAFHRPGILWLKAGR